MAFVRECGDDSFRLRCSIDVTESSNSFSTQDLIELLGDAFCLGWISGPQTDFDASLNPAQC
jgi:hypothetical protein